MLTLEPCIKLTGYIQTSKVPSPKVPLPTLMETSAPCLRQFLYVSLCDTDISTDLPQGVQSPTIGVPSRLYYTKTNAQPLAGVNMPSRTFHFTLLTRSGPSWCQRHLRRSRNQKRLWKSSLLRSLPRASNNCTSCPKAPRRRRHSGRQDENIPIRQR